MNYIEDAGKIFRRVKNGFTYKSDKELYDKPEDWRFPENYDRIYGDCDDFAIACRSLLKKKGHDCRLIFCMTEDNSGHLICSVGKLALDNRLKWPMKLSDLVRVHGYKIISVSGLNRGDPWKSASLKGGN